VGKAEGARASVLGGDRARPRGSDGGGTAGAWRTRGHDVEHLASSERGKMGRVPRLAPGQIWTRAQNEDRSPHDALRFSLRSQGH
jgi:hypothetical protein